MCDCKACNSKEIVIENVPETGTLCDKCPGTECICRLCKIRSAGKPCLSATTEEVQICNFPTTDEKLQNCLDVYMDRMGFMEN